MKVGIFRYIERHLGTFEDLWGSEETRGYLGSTRDFKDMQGITYGKTAHLRLTSREQQ